MVRRIRSACAGRRTDRAALLAAVLATAASSLNANPEPVDLTGSGFEVEAFCTAESDVFAGDGEGYLHQYWRTTSGLVPVRTLPTNPDVEQCVVGPRLVYFLDPEFGVLAYERSPETDPILRPVYLAPPQGSGRFRPVALALFEGAEPRLRVIGGGGETEDIAMPPAVPATTRVVYADIETDPTHRRGDAADDPAVIYSVSGDADAIVWILGTDKQHGLRVFDLSGRQLQELPVGRLNNVDALPLATGGYLVAASNRTSPSIDLFHADPGSGLLERLAPVPLDFAEPYGLCMAELGGQINVFVGDKTGAVQRWRIDEARVGHLVESYRFDSLTEGCVVDTEAMRLFVGEEDVGIWSIDLRSAARSSLDRVANGWLTADVEGLDIYHGDGVRYLVASSQGDDSYVVYELPDGKPLLKFAIVADTERGIDGVSETDGIAVTAQSLPGFPSGILVAQDGRNVAPADNQNFKIVDWRRIEALLAEAASRNSQ